MSFHHSLITYNMIGHYDILKKAFLSRNAMWGCKASALVQMMVCLIFGSKPLLKRGNAPFWYDFCQLYSKTHTHTPCILLSHHSHSWNLYSIPSQGKMQFNIHLVIYASGWNLAPFWIKWEIPSVLLFSDLWIFGRPAAFNHKDAD